MWRHSYTKYTKYINKPTDLKKYPWYSSWFTSWGPWLRSTLQTIDAVLLLTVIIVSQISCILSDKNGKREQKNVTSSKNTSLTLSLVNTTLTPEESTVTKSHTNTNIIFKILAIYF